MSRSPRAKQKQTARIPGPAGARSKRRPSHDIVALALAEDLGTGDLTSGNFVPARSARARIFAKQRAVLAGVEVAAAVFRRVDPKLKIRIKQLSGKPVAPGVTVLEVEGAVRSILTAERVALNFVQRLSGIATLTRRFVDAVGRHRARILDTRKTTPGLRALEKAAVAAGGGVNHRFGLDDMVMIKDNHLLAADGARELQRAIDRFRATHRGVRIEVEADTLGQVRTFLGLRGIDLVLLDNMRIPAMARAVQLGGGRLQFEASGNVTLRRVAAIAATGVDFISVGALTHSAPAIDFSLELVK